MASKTVVLIYRDQLLPYSETFIPAQGEVYETYQSFYVGDRPLRPSPLKFSETINLRGRNRLMLSGYVWLRHKYLLRPV